MKVTAKKEHLKRLDLGTDGCVCLRVSPCVHYICVCVCVCIMCVYVYSKNFSFIGMGEANIFTSNNKEYVPVF